MQESMMTKEMTEDVAAKIEKFFNVYRLRSYSKGQVLILGGEDTGLIYHLVKGRVKVYDVGYRGDEIVLNVFQPPAFFPMAVAINGTPNPYVYEAETEVEIRQAPAADVVVFIKANPEVMYDLLSRLYQGVDGLLGRMALLMDSSAKKRLLYELIIEARRFGQWRDDGGCAIAINEKSLGSRAGLTRETVSREIRKLKQEKLIEIRDKSISIKDVQALEQKLYQEA
jgi:CRP-like cAMP-binding protein